MILTQTMYFPGTPPPLVGPQRITEDGPPGWQVVCWWRASPQLCELLQKPKTEWPPHLKLWRRVSSRAPRPLSVLNGSLKGVGIRREHPENSGLPRLLHQFNAKPVLMAAAAPPWGGDRQAAGRRGDALKLRRLDDTSAGLFATYKLANSFFAAFAVLGWSWTSLWIVE